jgi:hypothetical protein
MKSHDWALQLTIPLTEKEVHELMDGKGISLREPNVTGMGLEDLYCRTCDLNITEAIGIECLEE